VAIGCFTIGCFSDAVDGYFARRLNERTELGAFIDPIADKLLLLSGYLSLSFMSHLPSAMSIPAWVTIPIISRDVMITIGSVILFISSGKFRPEPLFIGKLTTVSQMAALMSAFLMMPDGVKLSFCTAAVLLTVWSGILYMQMGARMFQNA
jgi:cardiolipin synthase